MFIYTLYACPRPHPQLTDYVTLLQLYTSIAEEDQIYPTLRTKLKVLACIIYSLSVHCKVSLCTQEYYSS